MSKQLSETDYPVPNLLKGAHCVFKGKRFDVCQLTIDRHLKEVIVHPGASVILPIKADGTVVMIKNHRFAVDETLLELPAGTIDPGEKPLTTATRELTEETGYVAKKVELLMEFYPSPGICTEKLYAYLATDLTMTQQHLDETESITVVEHSWEEIRQFIREGIIKDAKSLVTLMFYFGVRKA